MSPLVTTRAISRRLGLSLKTVQAWCRDGVFDGAMLIRERWYVPRESWERWLAVFTGKEEPKAPKGK